MKSIVAQVVLSVLFLVTISAGVPQPEVEVAAGRAGGSHNLILCDPNGNHRLAYSHLFTREALFLKVRTETIFWPINELNYAPIKCIRVIDKITNNLGGYVEITRGGLEHNQVEFVFTSQWSRRMSFQIEIYVEQ